MVTGETTHIIYRQVFDLECSSEEIAGKLQKELPEFVENELSARLDTLFSGLSGESNHLVIDRLELDLGQIPYPELGKQLGDMLISRIEKEMTEVKTHGLTREFSRLQSLQNDVTGKQDDKIRESILMNEDEMIISGFIHFLKFGMFPWYFIPRSSEEIEKSIREIADRDPEKIPGELSKIMADPGICERITKQFSKDFNYDLLKQLFRGDQTINLIIQEIRKKGLQDPISSEMLLSDVWHSLATGKKSLNKPGDDQPEGALDVYVSEWIKSDKLNLAEKFGQGKTKKPEEQNLPFSEIQTEEIYQVENAGLILLTPFLERFFTRLGLYQDKAFIPGGRERALYLTSFLVTGKAEAEEHFLILNKVLLGWPIKKTIKKEFNMSVTECDECHELLRSVISHWEILKNTSVDGLREAFLLRKGRLERENTRNWLLRVERRPYDILLDHLPWSFTTVKLPWMESLICTVW